MGKTKTLPPLVRGKVRGILDFFIDEIKLRDNVILLTDKSDLVLQVQWWGEDLSTYVRPKNSDRLKLRISEDSDIHHFGSIRYEIKTTLDLFKLYLKTCEVLELCILDAVKNCIIGSAFLRDLVKLLNKGNDHFMVPVIDYLGEEIGDVVVCFKFTEKKQEEMTYKCKSDCSSKLGGQDLDISNKKKEYSFNPVEENFFYDRGKKITIEKPSTKSGSMDKYAFNKNKRTDYINYDHDTDSKFSTSLKKFSFDNKKYSESMAHCCKCLPEIQTASDSSKILYFGSSSQKSKKIGDENNNPRIIVTNKFNTNSIKCKSKSPNTEKFDSFPLGHTFYEKKMIKKKPESQAIFRNIQKEADIKQNENFLSCKTEQSQNYSIHNQTDIRNIPSKEPFQTKVLDYLLGSNLSKEDEESAANEFKKMSPSHNLVTSINQLCLTSDNHSHNSVNMYCANPLQSSRQSCLSYNLNNPIERNYYEKFFLKTNPSHDHDHNLELAELLNQPENSAALEKLEKSQTLGFKSSKFSLQDKEVKMLKNDENFSELYCNKNDRAKECARCKYYKKLDDLDTIIESLKHFEEKMKSHEKDMTSLITGSSDLFSKKSQLKNS